MSSSAYNHGIKAASVWKRLSNVYSDADSRFTAWAVRKGIPVAVGKTLVPFSALLLMASALIAGFAVGAVIIAAAAFVYMVRYIQMNQATSADPDESPSANGPDFRNGRDGYGYYYGADDSIFSSTESVNNEEENKA
ncbi:MULTISPECIES: DUF3742 family protein [unclassified Pantoea]|uniref:DUF3742 family protein n=1 Tax=unclassified Pantoea TaxID=2630326 RepID=UPI001CD2EF96|nr:MULTISPECIES: DUF3742 family protein [unclassified Pantoea]MCA1179512.1 DUF3742 family protein [Pantoea sp. alder69]MCA1251765.1 DUF3742 family protein [Pantoea sp. alder70]MCA1267898.1 DUF3742 family protein [Pantoea sp. alder81]